MNKTIYDQFEFDSKKKLIYIHLFKNKPNLSTKFKLNYLMSQAQM